ncbi:MAG: hypothetical protein H6707_02245 [Deltaproteobacteria bacterium]|nr:hypothetical protein [Deltaproteobacteria bacterium]
MRISRVWSFAARCLPLVLLIGTASSCRKAPPAEPEVLALRAFFEAMRGSDRQAVFDALTPELQKRLVTNAKLATAQTGGQRQYKPIDLIGGSLMYRWRERPKQFKLVNSNGRAALIEVIGGEQGADVVERWQLRRVGKTWRVLLPAGSDASQPSASQPSASQPSASQPSASQPSGSGPAGK